MMDIVFIGWIVGASFYYKETCYNSTEGKEVPWSYTSNISNKQREKSYKFVVQNDTAWILMVYG